MPDFGIDEGRVIEIPPTPQLTGLPQTRPTL
jgi:hypothetical protein